MPDTATISADYDAMAAAYAAHVREHAHDQPLPDAMIAAFAATAGGRVLDAGCGPGHWTSWLCGHGLDAEGIDVSPGQIATAREWHPDLVFTIGSFTDLAAPDGTYGGVLANFSLIHTPPADVPAVLAEFARVLARGGVLLIGGFAELEQAEGTVGYDHKVCPAYRWAPESLAAAVRDAGLTETARLVMQPPPDARSAGVYLMATKGEPAVTTF